jgi:hypothetical protein
MRANPAKEELTISFAHVAYRMAERFARRETGIRHFQVSTLDERWICRRICTHSLGCAAGCSTNQSIGIAFSECSMALPCGPRFRLRRNHACGAFPPFGFHR